MVEVSAGGVVYRKTDSGVQIQLIQDRFYKYTFPKGKREPGESLEQTALREIEEETGIVGEIIAPIARIEYEYISPEQVKVNKEVHYFLVEAKNSELHAQYEEIHGVAWFNPQQAYDLLRNQGYDNNLQVIMNAIEGLGIKVNENE